MKRHMGSKFGVVWLILSLIILAPVLVQAKEKGKY